MKLYSLELRAVGPFPGRHSVDFAALGRSGLFLLEGPTGAGKSTIIDAVVFALYGHLAGLGASKQRLYSHHAEPGVEPYVDLIFEVEAGLFRIRRTPSFERPKKRGTGTRTINETVVLMRLTDIDQPDRGTVISTRAQEVGDEIVRLIGLRRNQFLQTVVLPQGEFATFLRASGEDRKRLLETIFRTDIYERITAELVERRKAAARRTTELDGRVDSARQVLRKVAEIEAEVFDVDTLVADSEKQISQARSVADHARQALSEAESALKNAEAEAAALTQRRELLARQAKVDAVRDDIEQATDRLAGARRAAQVLPLVRAEEAAVSALRIAGERRADASAKVPQLTDTAAAQQHSDEIAGQLHQLAELTEIEASFPRRSADLESLHQAVCALDQEVAELAERAKERPAQIAELESQQTELDTELGRRPNLELGVLEAAKRLEATQQAAAVQRQLVQAKAEVKKFAGDATTAAHVVKELQLARIRGMAGELAEALVVGDACVVCGSNDHPHPAQRSTDHPDTETIETAERRLHDLDRSLAEASTALEVAEQQSAFWLDQSGRLTVDEAQTAHDSAASSLAALDQVAEQRNSVAGQLAGLATDARRDEQRQAALQAERTGLIERSKHQAESLATDQQRIASVLDRRAKSLTALRTELEHSQVAARSFIEASHAAEVAGNQLDSVRAELVDALTSAEFADPDDVRSHALNGADVERLQHRVDAHRQESAVVAAGLAEPQIAALTGNEEPDVAAARDVRAAAADAHEAAVGLADIANRRHRQISDAVAELRQVEAALERARGDSAVVTRLAGLADASSPQNLSSVTLGTYVLLRRFEQVVQAANRRLGPMSDGRYHLRVSDQRERTGSGRRTGLSLAVIDAETGREREPRTLSGGETFYVSLCLALGLADVVSAESGGVRLSTLFVDEGFGSLDPDTLDAVMAQLSQLAQGGRAVGLVSHVAELKQRVADRISVRRHRDGTSSLSVVA